MIKVVESVVLVVVQSLGLLYEPREDIVLDLIVVDHGLLLHHTVDNPDLP